MVKENAYAERFRAVVLDNASMTDGLNDDEARVLIDWALKLAEQVGANVVDDADVETKQGELTRFLSGFGRLVTRRHEHPEPEWAAEKLQGQMEHSAVISGPTLSAAQMGILAAAVNNHALSNMEVLRQIIAAYGSTESPMPTPPAPSEASAQDEANRGFRKIIKKLGF